MADFIREDVIKVSWDVETLPFGEVDNQISSMVNRVAEAVGGMTGIAGAAKGTASEMSQIAAEATKAKVSLEGVGTASDGIHAAGIKEVGTEVQETAQGAQKASEQIKSLTSSLMAAAGAKLNAIPTAMKNSATAAREFAAQLKAATADKLSSSIDKVKSGISGLKNISLKSLVSSIDTGLGKGMQKVGEAAKAALPKIKEIAKTSMDSLKSGVTGAAGKLKELAQTSLSGLKSGLSNVGDKLKEIASTSFSKLKSGLLAVAKGVAIGALAASTTVAGLGIAGVRAGVEYESAFAGVRKTVEATEVEYQALSDGIRGMSLEMPTSASEIAGVAEAAGQLGIATGDILGFTETMVMLGDATNLSANDAATTFARFANVTGMSAANYSNLGSTVVALGNNFATTEAEIASMAQNIASAGSQVGMTEPQIMGIAAALSSVGVEAQAGGTAISKSLINMQVAVETGNEDLQNFAKVAGMTSQEFATAFETDAAGAFQSFISGLADTENLGQSTIAMLEEMGISETRLRDSLMRAANAQELFNDAQSVAQLAWDENNALTNEASQRYATMESQLSILKNKATDLGIEFYQSVNSPMAEIVGTANDMMDGLSAAFKADGLHGLVGELGNVLGQVVTGITGALPDIVNAGVSLIDNLLSGIKSNTSVLASGASVAISSFISGLGKLIPRIILIGMDLLTQLAEGLTSEAPKMVDAASEALVYLMEGLGKARPKMAFAAVKLVTALFDGMIENIPELLSAGLSMCDEVIQGLLDGLPMLVLSAGKIVNSLLSTLMASLPMLVQSGLQMIISLILGIVQQLPTLINMATSLMTGFISTIATSLPQLMDMGISAVLNLVMGIVIQLPAIIQAAMGLIQSLISTLVQVIPMMLQTGLQAILGFILGIVGQLPAIIQAGVQLLVSLVLGIIQAIPQLLGMAVEMMGSFIETILSVNWLQVGWDIIKAILGGLWEGAQALASGIWDGIKSLFGKGGKEAGEAGAQGVADGMSGSETEVAEATQKMTNGLLTELADGQTQAIRYGADTASSYASGIDLNSYMPQGAAQTAAGDTSAAFGGMADTSGYGHDIMANLADGISAGGGLPLQAAEQTVFNTDATMQGLGNSGSYIGQDLVGNMADSILSESGNATAAAFDLSGMVEEAGNSELDVKINADVTSIGTSASQVNTSVAAMKTDIESLQGAVTASMAVINSSVAQGSAANSGIVMTWMSQINTAVNSGLAQLNSAFSGSMSTIQNIVNSGMSAVRAIVASINLYSAGVSIMQGLANGMNSMRGSLLAAASSIASSISSTINSSLDIHSPSRVTFASGKYTGLGLVKGMEKATPVVETTAKDMASSVTAGIKPIVPQPEQMVFIPTLGILEGLTSLKSRGRSQPPLSREDPSFNLGGYGDWSFPDDRTTQGSTSGGDTYNLYFSAKFYGSVNDSETERQVKRWVREEWEDIQESVKRKNPSIRRV